MLTRQDIETLINAPDTNAAARLLHERGWEGETLSALLKNEQEHSWNAAYEVCAEDTPIDILLYENDFHNLKTILKAHIAAATWENMILEPSVVKPASIADAIRDGNFEQLPPFIRNTAAEAYKLLTTTMDGQLAEVFIDKAEHIAVYNRAKAEKSEYLIGWAELLADISNMKAAWRSAYAGKGRDFIQNALIPVGAMYDSLLTAAGDISAVHDRISAQYPDAPTGSIGEFERWCDNKKLEYIRTAKAQSFGFLPILAFLIGKRYEIQAVRIILSCKENGVGEQVIRERLRDIYV